MLLPLDLRTDGRLISGRNLLNLRTYVWLGASGIWARPSGPPYYLPKPELASVEVPIPCLDV